MIHGARRALRSPATAAAFVALVLATSACRSVGPTPAGPSPTATRASVSASSASSPVGSRSAPQSTPFPTSESPAAGDSANLLRLCDNGPDQPSDIDCRDAIDVALSATHPLAAPFRAEVRWTRLCPFESPCASAVAEPDRVFVVLYLDDGTALEVALVLENGGLVVATATPLAASYIGPRPAFISPERSRADVGPAPATVSDRPALPFCGAETAGLAGPFNVAARRCFLGSLLAGDAAEFASNRSDVGGAPFLELWRFTGAGPVVVLRREAAGWSQLVCGVALVADVDQQFDHTDCSTAPLP